jgi:hypothetical protein
MADVRVCPHCGSELDPSTPQAAKCPVCRESLTAPVVTDNPAWKRRPEGPSNETPAEVVLYDVVTGPNLRWKDNLVQGLAILACLLIGTGLGPIFVDDWRAGMLVGGFCGLVLGLLVSGFVLMIYRMFRH